MPSLSLLSSISFASNDLTMEGEGRRDGCGEAHRETCATTTGESYSMETFRKITNFAWNRWNEVTRRL